MPGLLDPDELLKPRPAAGGTPPPGVQPWPTMPLPAAMPGGPPMQPARTMPPPAAMPGGPMPAVVAPPQSRLPADADPRATLLALFKAYGLT
jgi:hypothetical protein